MSMTDTGNAYQRAQDERIGRIETKVDTVLEMAIRLETKMIAIEAGGGWLSRLGGQIIGGVSVAVVILILSGRMP